MMVHLPFKLALESCAIRISLSDLLSGLSLIRQQALQH